MTLMNLRNESATQVQKTQNSHRMIVCDIDGTLVARDHQIHPADVAALADARAAGFTVSICTGRSIREAIDIIKPLRLTGPGVFVTGAAVCDLQTGDTIERVAINPQTVRRLIDFFGNLGHAVLLLVDTPDQPGPRYIMTSHGPVHAASEEWFIRNKMPAATVENPDETMLRGVLRLGIVVDLPQSAEITAQLSAAFGNQITFLALKAPAFECHVIEVFAGNVNKWTGIQRLCNMLKIDSHAAIPIGDDVNDLPMLRHASLSFAMGNAAPEVKIAAKRITRSQADAGVAAAVREILKGTAS
jgi:Cof subfamily protein (haloacid dehalogenase superfamily)